MRAGDDMPRGEPRAPRARRPGRGRVLLVIAAVGLFLLVTTLRSIASFYTDYLWFQSIGQTGVWRGVLGTKLTLAFVFIAIFFVLLWLNLLIADRLAPKFRPAGPEEELIERYHELVGRRTGLVRIAVALLFAVIAGAGASGQWQEWLLFRNYVPFNVQDPQFHKDVGFYVFQLPFLSFLVGWFFAAFVIVLIVSAVAHYLNGGIRVQTPFQRVTPQVKAHLSVLLAVIALVKAAGYYVQQYTLSISTRGTVDGPTYTDVHTQLPAIKLLMVISLFSVGLFLYNIFRRGWVLPVLGVGLWFFVAVVAGTIVPTLVQKFQVEPSESTKERPYIDRNIKATRAAMNLSNVTTTSFDNDNQLNTANVLANKDTVDNIRLWDPNIMPDTYRALQSLKPFYKIEDVDVDRYILNGNLTQVVLSARELNSGGVPQQSWEGTHLAFTHGYGVVLSSSSAQTADGQPDQLIRGIPITNETDIKVDRPGIYFGQRLDGYVVVNSKRQEIDFEDTAGRNETTTYTGADGVKMDSWIKRAAFALRFGDFNPLVSGNVTSSSRILINRDINARLQSIAPFLTFDADPYPAVIDGKVQWIVDGYTTTDRYPYAQRAVTDSGSSLSGRFNYVRNSVKAVIDAYDGTTTLYIVDHADPIIRAYQKAFPKLFAATEPSEQLKAHFRYPEDIFRVQTNMWGRYHLDNTDDFYTQGPAWSVAPDPGTTVQTGATNTTATTVQDNSPPPASGGIAPYYQLMRLPGETEQRFSILRPFVPTKGNGKQMTAFMVAKSDPEHYGELETFVMPGDRLPPAPTLVASTMSSDTAVSSLQTLLGINTGGSKLFFGNLLIVPIEHSLLYVRPVYVQASGDNNPPLLRKVVVEFNNQVSVADTLAAALKQFSRFSDLPVDGTTPVTPPVQGTTPTPPTNQTATELLAQALQDFQDANNALKQGDLATYKLKIDDAERKTQQANQILSGSPPDSTASSSTTTTLSGASA
ncbi:MAG: uncharacterized protein QOI95_4441 [Acidimicrobiaceae bacterium]|jgi:uncharacterized membrane protein (UPF0182 family)